MISFHQLDHALKNRGLKLSPSETTSLLNTLLPDPQCGFSCDGATVWGDNHSIDKVKRWNGDASTIPSLRAEHSASTKAWRTQHDAQQARAMRAEELGIQMLAFIQSMANSNPAHNASSALAHQFLEDRHIEVVEGFFHTQDAAIADAREKFYAAAHPPRPK